MNTRRKKNIKKEDFFSSVKFCTECGDNLNDFALSKDSADEEAVREHHQVCINTKKFKGDLCSKLFITMEDESSTLQNDEPVSDIIPPEDEF